MAPENEIFEEYALTRLMEDPNLGDREYLDSSEFNLAHSPSLEFLAKQADIKLTSAEPRWITEGSTEENGLDYYRDEPERVYVILTSDIVQARHDNLKHILPKLPKSLASKIQTFEKNTKYLYASQSASTEEILGGLKSALSQFENNITIQRLIINHAKRIAPEISKREQNKIAKRQEKDAKQEQGQQRFYAIIRDIHNPQNKNNRIELYKSLFRELKNQNEDDIRRFLKAEDYNLPPSKLKARLKTLKAHVTTELVRDIDEQLYKLYKEAFLPEAKFFEQELKAYNKACAYYKERLLGPKGAFEKGGFYGPDSSFSGLSIQKQNTPSQNTNSLSKPLESKEEQLVQLKLFTDKHFEY